MRTNVNRNRINNRLSMHSDNMVTNSRKSSVLWKLARQPAIFQGYISASRNQCNDKLKFVLNRANGGRFERFLKEPYLRRLQTFCFHASLHF